MIRPKVFSFVFALVAAFYAATGAFAAEPTLTTKDSDPLPVTVKQNEPLSFILVFKDADGDRIKSSTMQITTPDGTTTPVPGKNISNDTANGVDVAFQTKAGGFGKYKVRFIVSSTDGEVLYPPRDQPEYEFSVENLWIKIGIFVGGLLVCLAGLPMLVYQVSRSMNRSGDPANAARGGLLLGVLMCGALFIYLFASFLGAIAIGIGIIGALAGIVTVLTQRRR